jgi:hypothetical protein
MLPLRCFGGYHVCVRESGWRENKNLLSPLRSRQRATTASPFHSPDRRIIARAIRLEGQEREGAYSASEQITTVSFSLFQRRQRSVTSRSAARLSPASASRQANLKSSGTLHFLAFHFTLRQLPLRRDASSCPYLRSQIYSLRAFSTFRLTAGQHGPAGLASTRETCLSLAGPPLG